MTQLADDLALVVEDENRPMAMTGIVEARLGLDEGKQRLLDGRIGGYGGVFAERKHDVLDAGFCHESLPGWRWVRSSWFKTCPDCVPCV